MVARQRPTSPATWVASVYAFYEAEGINGEAFLWSALEGKHLLDESAGKQIV